MANRSDLAITELDKFESWLVGRGYKILETKGCYEELRWKGDKGQPMPIIFKKDSAKVHLSCNDSAHRFVRTYLNQKKYGEDNELTPNND